MFHIYYTGYPVNLSLFLCCVSCDAQDVPEYEVRLGFKLHRKYISVYGLISGGL
jgi:hypothetical protein